MERWLFYLSSVAFLCLLARKAFSQECAEPLGMENGAIADAQISASSVYSGRHVARNARLNFAPNPGCWSAKVKDLNQWLQVVFNSETKITRIATQGRYSGSGRSQWVTNYTLQYKNDGDAFEVYKQAGETSEKFFKGNNDSDTIVYHQLNPPITARYIRVRPVSWYTHISMRMELYGCQEDQYCRELKFTTVIKETALRKHVIRTIDGIEEDLCGAKCFMENNCVSYNFLNAPSGGETCELNNYTANEHPEHLEVTTGSLYKGSPNACGNMPCKNNATCQTGFTGKGYRCLCAEGFLGVECEVDIDECASIPCQNGGSCQDLVNSYTCTCLPGYHGSQCQQEPVECSTYTPLTSADRRKSGRAIKLCDAHLNGWYRFTGAAGTQMLEHCLNTYDRCSASYPGYLVGGQPTAEEGQASRSVCFYNGGCDQQCRNILVRKCVTFLVYRFEAADSGLCGFRYCGST